MTRSAHDLAHVRQLFDEQVRRGTASDGTGNVVAATPRAVRWSGDRDGGWSEVAWSGLDESTADAEISDQIKFFSSRGLGFAWRVYDGDAPVDLGTRLEHAGFEYEGTSELMVAEIADVPRKVILPSEVTLTFERGAIGIDRLIEVHERVFGTDHSHLRRSLQAQFSASPQLSELVVAMANDVPIASSRVEFLPDRQFASFWGGSTLPQWRGRGLFRAMVSHRAREAAERGYRYAYVIASSDSRPILERLSFASLGPVSTYMWQPTEVPA